MSFLLFIRHFSMLRIYSLNLNMQITSSERLKNKKKKMKTPPKKQSWLCIQITKGVLELYTTYGRLIEGIIRNVKL